MISCAKHSMTGFSLNWIVACEGPTVKFPLVGNWIGDCMTCEGPDKVLLGVGCPSRSQVEFSHRVGSTKWSNGLCYSQ